MCIFFWYDKYLSNHPGYITFTNIDNTRKTLFELMKNYIPYLKKINKFLNWIKVPKIYT